MTKERYQRMLSWFDRHPAAAKALCLCSKGFTASVYAGYTLLVLYSAVFLRNAILRVLLVPFLVFVLGSLLRQAINAPRPYEVYGCGPLSPKDTSGLSFPSRHVFCASVIACAFWYISPPSGVLFAGIALIIAISRVLTGVHFPRDVLAGMLFGGLLGFVGFFLLP